MNQVEATFGAGCFWGVEETFRKLPGVIDTTAGYMGGEFTNPTYDDVCTDTTGHAEVVHITYDAEKISYNDLLKVFLESHNPTTPNQQGPDIGSQYRSVIFYYNQDQQDQAEQSKKMVEASHKYQKPIVTQIIPAETFYKAEEYHQRYLEKKGLASCHI